MKASIIRRTVLIATFLAQYERGQGSVDTIVGMPVNDRKPGTAFDTANKRLEIATIIWIKHLLNACSTGRDVGRDARPRNITSGAFPNPKMRIVSQGYLMGPETSNFRALRWCRSDRSHEFA